MLENKQEQAVEEIYSLLKQKGLTVDQCNDILHKVKDKCYEPVLHLYEEARNTIVK